MAPAVYHCRSTRGPVRFRRAVACNAKGISCHRRGDFTGAELQFRKAVAYSSKCWIFLNNLGCAFSAAKAVLDANGAFVRAMSAEPKCSLLYSNWAFALEDGGAGPDAIIVRKIAASYESTRRVRHPLGNEIADLLMRHAKTFCDSRRYNEAEIALKTAFDASPRAAILASLSTVQVASGKYRRALATSRACLALEPAHRIAHWNAAWALHKLGRSPEAVYHCRFVLADSEADADKLFAVACMLLATEEGADQVEALRRFVAIAPGHRLGRFLYGTSLLRMGNFQHGWKEYEYRPVSQLMPPWVPRQIPEWTGQPISGRTLIVFCEQGYGDTIQFVRYIRLVQDAGAKVILVTFTELVRIFECLGCAVTSGEVSRLNGDYYTRLMSLPLRINALGALSPADTPYLAIDRNIASVWQAKLSSLRHPRIGLVWGGRRTHDAMDALRSLPVACFGFLSNVEAEFVSLQKGDHSAEIAALKGQLRVIDYTNEVLDFADTAGIIQNLDLVISVDTAVAHLAGAMGAPVWMLSRYAGCWRWLLNRSDSPWYPSMRIFRQEKPGEWHMVMEEVARSLTEWIMRRTFRISPSLSQL